MTAPSVRRGPQPKLRTVERPRGMELQRKILERKARLAAVDLERAALMGEIRAYEDALRQLPVSLREGVVPTVDRRGRGRLFSRGWGQILATASGAGNKAFGFAELQNAVQQHRGSALPDVKLRGQIGDYVRLGYLARLRRGEFSLTINGIEALASFLPSENHR